MSRQRSLAAGLELTDSLAKVNEEQTTRGLTRIDNALRSISAGLRELESKGAVDPATARSLLRSKLRDLPDVRELLVVDGDNRLRYSSGPEAAGADMSKQGYSVAHRQDGPAGFHLHEMGNNSPDDQQSLFSSRSIRNADGSLDAVVVARIDPEHFVRRWSQSGEGSTVLLLRRDGTVLLSSPSSAAKAGKKSPNAPMLVRRQAEKSEKSFVDDSAVSSSANYFAYRTLDAHPDLMLAVERDVPELAGNWNAFVGLLLAAFALFSVGALAYAVQQSRLSERRWSIRTEERIQIEQSLDHSRLLFRTAFDSSCIGMSITALNGGLLEVNQALREIVGYSAEQLSLLSFKDITYPGDLEPDLTMFAELAAGTMPSYQLEKRYVRHDGELVWVSLIVTLVRDAAGLPLHAIAQVENIQQRKALELELQASQNRLKATLDAMPELMFEIDIEGVFHDFHSTRPDLLVQAPEAFLGKSIHAVMPPDVASTAMDFLHKVNAGGVVASPTYALAIQGEQRWFEMTAAKKMGSSDQPQRFIVLSHDVTERTHAFEALKRSEELLRELAEAVHEALCVVDPFSGKLLYLSSAFEKITGFGPSDIVDLQTAFNRIVHPDDLVYVTAQMVKASSGQTIDARHRIVRRDGEMRWIRGRSFSVLAADGSVSRIVGSFEDINEQYLREQREIEERTLLEFLSGTHSTQAILARATLSYESQLPGMMSSMLLLDSEGRHLSHAQAPHLPQAYCDAIDGIEIGPSVGSCGTAAFNNESVFVTDIANDPRWAGYADLALAHGLQACWSAPIRRSDGSALGTFAFYFAEPREPTEAERNLVNRAALLTGQALEVRESQAILRQLSARLLQTQESERRHLALELHDDLGQVLTAIKINLLAEQRLGTKLDASMILGILDEALERVRDLATALRPPMLDDLGLVPALSWVAEVAGKRSGLEVTVVSGIGKQRRSSETETTCFRIAQEAITNIERHAQATKVEIELSGDGTSLQMQIRDDGRGFDIVVARRAQLEGRSMGLAGMRERASLVGGSLEVETAPGKGTLIRLHCPDSPAVTVTADTTDWQHSAPITPKRS